MYLLVSGVMSIKSSTMMCSHVVSGEEDFSLLVDDKHLREFLAPASSRNSASVSVIVLGVSVDIYYKRRVYNATMIRQKEQCIYIVWNIVYVVSFIHLRVIASRINNTNEKSIIYFYF